VNTLKELERLKELHGQLLRQARVILGLLEQDDEEAFENAMSQRVSLFNEMLGLHKRLSSVFAQWDRDQDGLGPARKEGAQNLVNQIRELGQQVLDVDQRACGILETRRANLSGVLGRLKKGKRVQQAYGGGSRTWWGPDRLSRMG
jgi:hypothetical protein